MYWGNPRIDLSELIGKTLSSVVNNGDEIVFETTTGETYKLVHIQDCCENVRVDDVIGDLHDLVGEPILVAEASSHEEGPPRGQWDESFTWTFYKFATRKGYVDIRWYGTSNGYYSEKVDFIKM